MPRLALALVLSGLSAILVTFVLVMADAALPGRVPLFSVALLAGLGGVALVGGLFLIEPPGKPRNRSLKA